MSSMRCPPLYNGRGLDQQWLNLIFQSHDLHCGCNKVIDHLKSILPASECRSVGTSTEITGDADTNMDAALNRKRSRRNFRQRRYKRRRWVRRKRTTKLL